jgi:carbamoyl-phosphate synthase large subunit
MARIHIGGAGGAPSNNVIRSLRDSARGHYLIGASSVPSDLLLADVDEKYVVPNATEPAYRSTILDLLARTRPSLMHVQSDYEVRVVSQLRSEIQALGVRLFLPSPETVENCVDKEKSYRIWAAAGLRVPRTILLETPEDLKRAFSVLGTRIWIRATEGGGGRGALPTASFDFGRAWIDEYRGWGCFTAAELLTDRSVTWQSIWYEGSLVVAQARRRHRWNYGNRTLSGVTGITGVGETCSDEDVTRVALDAIAAIDARPHGVFCVDMTYDRSGAPNPTEINIGRFFTTSYFFTKAGLNFPEIYCDLALEGRFPSLSRTINPLPDGLVWIRGMDVAPVLTTREELARLEASVTWGQGV